MRRALVRTLDTVGGALIGVALLYALLYALLFRRLALIVVALLIAVVGVVACLTADRLTARGWRR